MADNARNHCVLCENASICMYFSGQTAHRLSVDQLSPCSARPCVCLTFPLRLSPRRRWHLLLAECGHDLCPVIAKFHCMKFAGPLTEFAG